MWTPLASKNFKTYQCSNKSNLTLKEERSRPLGLLI